MSAEAMRALGEEIRRQRVEMALGPSEFARSAGIHRNYLHSVEAGERNVSVTNLKRIADALDTDLVSLLEAAFGDIGRKSGDGQP